MTRNDIIRMAREAGAWSQQFKNRDVEYVMSAESLERFAAFVRADEREAVCRIVTGLCISDNNSEEINRAIRARGQS
jgi:hypothetical protein